MWDLCQQHVSQDSDDESERENSDWMEKDNLNEDDSDGNDSDGIDSNGNDSDAAESNKVNSDDSVSTDSGSTDSGSTDSDSTDSGSTEYDSEEDGLNKDVLDEDDDFEEAIPDWTRIHLFHNKAELDKFFKQEGCWSLRSSHGLAKGKKKKMRCNHIKRNAKRQCDRELYTIRCSDYESDGEELRKVEYYEVFCNNLAHNHDRLADKSVRVAEYVKAKIIEAVENGKTPKQIAVKLRADGSIKRKDQPTMRQIRNVVQNYSAQQTGKEKITMKQLQDLVQAKMNIPENDDEAFVLGFERSPPSQKNNRFFRLFISTKTLLRNAANATTLNADGTHKITIEKLPLIVIGCTDVKGKFHLIGVGITNKETTDSYAMCFNAICSGVQRVTGN